MMTKPIGIGDLDAKKIVRCKDEGTDIEGVPALFGDPFFIKGDQLFQSIHEDIETDFGDAQSFTGLVHPLMVFLWTKEIDGSILSVKSLQAFKNDLSVMQGTDRRIDLNRSIGSDLLVSPFARFVFHAQHVV